MISICIPVYNFGAFLGETLDSILDQCQLSSVPIEVLVLDGASTDNTEVVVSSRLEKHSQLRYIRLPKKGGIDADLAESIQQARGEYCWLFSGDDLMHAGALQRALTWIEHRHDVYICKHLNCDIKMRVLGEHSVFRDNQVRVAELSDPHQRIPYFSAAVTTEAVFSFMSGLIVRRDKWLSVNSDQEFLGSCWAHVARLFTMAEKQLRVCYVGEAWLSRRGGNDSFRDRGLVHRLAIAVNGYHQIADRFYGHGSEEAAHIRRMVRNDLALRWWIEAKHLSALEPDSESRTELDQLVERCYGDTNFACWSARIIYRMAPVSGYRMLRWAYSHAVKRNEARSHVS